MRIKMAIMAKIKPLECHTTIKLCATCRYLCSGVSIKVPPGYPRLPHLRVTSSLPEASATSWRNLIFGPLYTLFTHKLVMYIIIFKVNCVLSLYQKDHTLTFSQPLVPDVKKGHRVGHQ